MTRGYALQRGAAIRRGYALHLSDTVQPLHAGRALVAGIRAALGRWLGGVVLASWLLACGGTPARPSLPREARPGAEQRPPHVARSPDGSLPRPSKARLENGLAVQLLERHGLPLLELRLVVLSGTATEGERPGVARLAAAALGAPARVGSRELAERVESLGAELRVQTTRDASAFALTLPLTALAEGLALLGTLTAAPRWSEPEFEQLRRRDIARVTALVSHSPSFEASVALYGELFRASPRRHPYGHFDALPSELEQLTLPDCRAWYETNFSPKNAFLLVVGETTLAQLLPLAEHALGAWQGREVAPPLFFTPPAPTRLKTLLVDRPNALQVELRVATLGPERHATGWSRLAVLEQLLGSGDESRSRRDLAEHGELGLDVSSALEQLAYGPTPLVLSTQAASERAPRVLGSLLGSFAALSVHEPEPRALRAATAQLSASLLLGRDTLAGTADQLSQASILGLPDRGLDEFRVELSRVTASEVRAAALADLKAPPIVVAVGDAARLITPLSHFGQVHVLNPQQGFRVERVVTQDPTAPLDLEQSDLRAR
jgi:zinc protease